MKAFRIIGGIALVVGLLGFAHPPVVLAADAGESMLQGLDKAAGSEGAGFDTEEGTATTVIANFVNALITVSGLIFLLVLVYGGFLYLTAGGNDENVKKAKRMLGAAVVGLIIITSSFAISLYVFDKLEQATGSTQETTSTTTS